MNNCHYCRRVAQEQRYTRGVSKNLKKISVIIINGIGFNVNVIRKMNLDAFRNWVQERMWSFGPHFVWQLN